MSVGFRMEYSVVIKGSKEDFEQIPAVVQKIAKSGKYGWNPKENYQWTAEYIADSAETAINDGNEPLIIELENSDDDASHGIFEDFLDGLDHKIPGLAIAVMATYVDTEYGGGDESSTYFSPSGTSKFELCGKKGNDIGCLKRSDKLPDEDWIPYGWRHLNEKAPAAKAEGTVTLLGDWSEAEKTIVDKALMSGSLEAMGYTAFEKGREAVTRTEEGWSFSVGGAMDAGEAVQHLHLTLLPYINKGHKRDYAALCKAMQEKKLAIHLYLDESTGPNAAWSYSNGSEWHFLITSNGARLVSKFTWCGTYRFSSRHESGSGKTMYEQATGDKWEELSDTAQFLMTQAILAYGKKHKAPEAPDIPDWILEEIFDEDEIEDEGSEDEDGEDYEYDEYDETAEAKEELAAYDETMKQYCAGLVPVLEKALANAPDLTPPDRFIPQTFDQRFAGKTFIVKGGLDGYEEGQVKELIEKFGGKVGKNITARTAYFVCGSGVGDPFKTALKHGTPLLSADYFEDMTR